MKNLIASILLLAATTFAQAEDTLCIKNEAGGEIHLLSGNKGYAIGTSPSGRSTRGTWELFGSTKILINWSGGDIRIYDLFLFSKCEL